MSCRTCIWDVAPIEQARKRVRAKPRVVLRGRQGKLTCRGHPGNKVSSSYIHTYMYVRMLTEDHGSAPLLEKLSIFYLQNSRFYAAGVLEVVTPADLVGVGGGRREDAVASG